MIYYKAVRPDGTDFYAGTVDYASLSLTGGKLPKLPGGEVCTSGVYHASDTPSETLIGGSWPCRLFLVTGKPVAQNRHKFGFRTLRVVGELEAWQVFGPNGREVVALIEQAKSLTPEQASAAQDAAWYAARDAAWHAARYAAGYAAWSAAQVGARGAARGAAWDAAWGAAQVGARGAAWVADWDAAWDAALNAAQSAALVLVVRDLITPEQFDVLYGPWKEMTE